MKGSYRIIIQNKRLRYEFTIRRNLTILRGDSATGKTTLIEMIQEYTNNGENSSIELFSEKSCYVLEGVTWKGQISVIQDSIVFIDEGNPFVLSDEFAGVIQTTDNYYVIVTRESIPSLPYSAEEIYGIRTNGRYGGLKQHYNEFFKLYSPRPARTIKPDVIVTEDSNAGFQFFKTCGLEAGIKTLSSGGKTRLLESAKEIPVSETILLIADGAAFGPEIDLVMKYISTHTNVSLYIPESFEWLILSSNVLKDKDISEILEDPSQYIESLEYFSWERFFTRLLTDRTRNTYLQYSKTHLNSAYLKGSVKMSIISNMPLIRFKTNMENEDPAEFT